MAFVIPDRILEEIRSRTSIVDVISSRVPLKRAGSLFKACCPFHKEKTPSFTVNPARETFKCFGCGEGGDVFSFLMKHDGMSFVDAVKMLGDRCGVEVEFGDDDGRGAAAKRLMALHTEIAEFYKRCLQTMKAAGAARKYIKSRELPDEIVERFGIGYAPDLPGTLEGFAKTHNYTIDEMVAAGLGTPLETPRADRNLHDRFRGRLMFPICDTQGRVVAFSGRILDKDAKAAKYVNSPETDIFRKSNVLYALDKAQRAIVSAPRREAIVCEGQIDVIRCHACGFDRAVASQGTAFTEEHAKLLKRYADSVVLVFDQDAAGQKAAVRTGAVLLAAGIPVRVAKMPEGEDPDSFLRRNPPEAFAKILEEAVGMVPFQVEYLRAQEPQPDSEGAAGRIAAGVLQTIASCRNEVHKARMLQEAAELMHLPESALLVELQGVEEAMKRQAESIARREAARSRFEGDPVPYGGQMVYIDDDFAGVRADGAGASAGGALAEMPDRMDVSVCELLVHAFYENREVVQLMSELLPAWLLVGDVCRRTVAGFYDALEKGEDSITELQEADAEVGEFIGALAVAPDKTGLQENFRAMDLAHDLILSQWRRWCETRKAALEPGNGEQDSPEAARRRIEFLMAERTLRVWHTGEALVRKLVEDAPAEMKDSTDSTAARVPALDAGSAEYGEGGSAEYDPAEEELIPDDESDPEMDYDF